MILSDNVSSLKMIGPIYVERLKKLNIVSIEDLLLHIPARYEDNSLISKINVIQEGERVTIIAKLVAFKNSYTKSGKKIQQARICDETGEMEVIWYNQPFLERILKEGSHISLSGNIKRYGAKLILESPDYEILSSFGSEKLIHTGRLVPIYPETEGLSSKWLRTRINTILTKFNFYFIDVLPPQIIHKYSLLPLDQAVKKIHFPASLSEADMARFRLAFDEVLFLQIRQKLQRAEIKKKLSAFSMSDKDLIRLKDFISNLPFQLTDAQNRCTREILADLGKKSPMNRLLQGDVGSGKTVVASSIMFITHLNGYRSAIMAPTEILAKQHYASLKALLSKFKIKVALKTSSQELLDTDYDVLVGTHSLISDNFTIDRLGLVVIDEQHKFGVKQRIKLIKKGSSPHVLIMTATPIPRTVAMTLYADLDVSTIDQMPLGRKIIKTWVVPAQKRDAAYKWIKEQLVRDNKQAFIICPFIDESESLESVRAVKKEFTVLSKDIYPELKLGLLHGRLTAKVAAKVLNNFKNKKIQILVTTPIVEVGMDIPDAIIMLIENADRFGLAQLHQLRGRVGRNNEQAYCLMFSQSDNPKSIQRLKTLETTNSGIKLAELDLKIRGAGDIYGLKQHGIFNLKVADITDLELMSKVRTAVSEILESKLMLEFPPLQERLERDKIDTVNTIN